MEIEKVIRETLNRYSYHASEACIAEIAEKVVDEIVDNARDRRL